MTTEAPTTNAATRIPTPDLPMVIRPAPPRLRDLEARLLHDRRLATRLRRGSGAVSSLAAIVYAADAAARARFASADELRRHLFSLVAG